MSFSHLHVHSHFSALDGYGTPKAFVERAKELGQEAIAFTEHGNVDSAVEYMQAGQELGVKIIAGCEFYIARDLTERDSKITKEEEWGSAKEETKTRVKSQHISVFAKNEKGWKAILEMLTYANLYGFYRKPRIDPETLKRYYNEGNILVSGACLGGFVRKGCEWGLKLAKELININRENFFLEIMPHNFPEQREHNKFIQDFSKVTNALVVATNDAHYPKKEHAEIQEVLLAVNSGDVMSDPKRFRFTGDDFYIASDREMSKMFRLNHPDLDRDFVMNSIFATEEVVKKCYNFYLEDRDPDLPLAPMEGLTLENEIEFFEDKIYQGLAEKRGKGLLTSPIKVYKDRIKEELQLIKEKGFCRYFLTLMEIVEYCKQEKIPIGPGRGSAAGCLIAWLVGITQVDPIKHDLLFFRFLNPYRFDYPDVDMDFCQFRRGDVIEHIKQVYGEDHVAQITTYLTLGGKSSIRDVSRVFEIPLCEVDELTKILEDDAELSENFFLYHENEIARNFYANHKKVIDIASKLNGTIRGYGKHAAGVVISNTSLSDGTRGNLCKRSGGICINWEKNTAESKSVQLIKMDILGLSSLTRQKICLDMIKDNRGIDIDLEQLSLEDEGALALVRNGHCLGVFQLSSYGITKLCVDVGVKSFADVSACMALFRPGPLGSGMVQEYIERASGKEYEDMHPSVKELLSETYGIIVYQEQIMKLAHLMAGFPLADTEKLRKLIAKSKGDEILKYKEKFIEGCFKTHNDWEGNKMTPEEIWEQVQTFGGYGFNKSHSVSYAYIGMYDAYLKDRYPGEFMASLLTIEKIDKHQKILEEARSRGVKVRLPKVGLSKANQWFFNPKTAELIMPISIVAGVGEKVAEQVVNESANKKKTRGFFKSTSQVVLPSKIKQVLSSIGAFEQDKEFTREDIKNEDFKKLFNHYKLEKFLYFSKK